MLLEPILCVLFLRGQAEGAGLRAYLITPNTAIEVAGDIFARARVSRFLHEPRAACATGPIRPAYGRSFSRRARAT